MQRTCTALAVVVPVRNEELGVRPLIDTLSAVLREVPRWSLIFIDDGSTDTTWERILQARAGDPRIEAIRLSRNFGKEAAMSAGLDVAEGDCVVVMDADLQDPPELIPQLLRRWENGADVVYGARRSRTTDAWSKRLTAKLFYRVFNVLSTIPIPADAGDFRLMDRHVVDVLRLLPERSRFMKGLFAWTGFQVESVPFDRPIRAAGETKFRLRGLWTFALDGLFDFSSKPLRVWTYLGALIVAACSCFGVVVVVQTLFFGNPVPGYASLTTLFILVSGVQIIGIGVLGEYISRVFIESKARPLYVVRSATLAPTADAVRTLGAQRSEIHTYENAGTGER